MDLGDGLAARGGDTSTERVSLGDAPWSPDTAVVDYIHWHSRSLQWAGGAVTRGHPELESPGAGPYASSRA